MVHEPGREDFKKFPTRRVFVIKQSGQPIEGFGFDSARCVVTLILVTACLTSVCDYWLVIHPLDLPGRHSSNHRIWFDVLGYYRTCCDKAAVAYRHACGDRYMGCKPTTIANNNGCGFWDAISERLSLPSVLG
jgi:hypothetical protein